jgi:tetratricopeptide (TPR) repeat protein
MALQVYASVHNYNEGKALYENKRWLAAIQQLDWAYRRLGTKNLETARLMTRIMTEHVNFYRQALPHIGKGLAYSATAADSAYFYYKQGICFKNLSKYKEADVSFHNALSQQPEWDSVYYQLGEVNTFALQNYEAGIRYFTQALEANPDFADCFMGRGYCHYQRKAFDIAVIDFNSFLKYSSKDRGTGFYLRGMALLESEHPELACQDFTAAAKLGAKGATAAMQKNCVN